MTNKHRAVLWFLSDTDESEVDCRIRDLEEADCNTTATCFVNVWEPFEYLTVGQLLKEIDKLETEFNKCQKPLFSDMIKAKNLIRDLRDGESHFCPAIENEEDECCCGEFDAVIDLLSD